jgi:uncharacterized membrane protein AbrB (regulator of aidB expression)
VIIALAARSVLPLGLVGAATILGVGLGGFIAGKWAKSAGLYHGAFVGAGWVALEAFGAIPTQAYSPDALTDTVIVTAIDVLTLIVSSCGGWLAWRDPSSSSGTGKAR